MKKIKEERIFCIGEELVIVNGKEITPIDLKARGIDENDILVAIDKQLQIRPIPKGAPAQIFRNAIEDIIGIPFCIRTFKYNGISIHDSELYRRYLPHILEVLNFEQKAQRYKEKMKDKESYLQKEGVYESYCRERYGPKSTYINKYIFIDMD